MYVCIMYMYICKCMYMYCVYVCIYKYVHMYVCMYLCM